MRPEKDVQLTWDSDDRPKVLLLIETEGWAFSRIAARVAEHFSDLYQFRTLVFRDLRWTKGAQADLVISFWWTATSAARRFVKCERRVTCIYDPFSWRHNLILFRRDCKHSCALVAANDDIAHQLKTESLLPRLPVFLCEDGVDTEAFKPTPLPSDLVVSWSGNSFSGGGIVKGLELIKAACKQEGITLLTADREVNPLPHDRIAEDLYHRSSAGVYASQAEGTPNPLLETMACGRPVAITPVGLAPKLIRDGENGVFINDRSVDGVVDALRRLGSMDREMAGRAARQAVESFDWKHKLENWREVLHLAKQKN